MAASTRVRGLEFEVTAWPDAKKEIAGNDADNEQMERKDDARG